MAHRSYHHRHPRHSQPQAHFSREALNCIQLQALTAEESTTHGGHSLYLPKSPRVQLSPPPRVSQRLCQVPSVGSRGCAIGFLVPR